MTIFLQVYVAFFNRVNELWCRAKRATIQMVKGKKKVKQYISYMFHTRI